MLTTFQLHIDGRRHTLLPASNIEAHAGEVLLIQADGQERRTALALALTGRMKPSSGTVTLGHVDTLAALRRRSAIINSPDVNEAENYMTVKSLASEDLALVPAKFRDRTHPTAWLVKHGFRDILDKWVEEVPADRLLHLLLALALSDQDVDLVVADSPDRHTADAQGWLELLDRTADGALFPSPEGSGKPLIVVAVVARIPDEWDGPTAYAGNAIMLADTGDTTTPTGTNGDVGTVSADASPPDPETVAEPETVALDTVPTPDDEPESVPPTPEPSPLITDGDGAIHPADVVAVEAVAVEEAPAQPHKDLS